MKAVIFGLFALTISQLLIAQVADDQPITAEKDEKYSLTIMANGLYLDQQGQETVDIIEGDIAYLAVLVETPAGQSVLGATPKFTIEGTTRMMALLSFRSRPTPRLLRSTRSSSCSAKEVPVCCRCACFCCACHRGARLRMGTPLLAILLRFKFRP